MPKITDLLDGETSRRIPLGKSGFDVYPVTLQDVAVLFESNPVEMQQLLDGDNTITSLVAKAPAFVARIIARAAREPEAEPAVLKMPVGVQIAALNAVWELSQIDPDMLGKLLAHLAQAVISAGQALPTGLKVSASLPTT